MRYKAHQRRYRVVRGLNTYLLEDLDSKMNNTSNPAAKSTTPLEMLTTVGNKISSKQSPDIKQGINLLILSRECKNAKNFSKLKLSNHPVADGNFNDRTHDLCYL